MAHFFLLLAELRADVLGMTTSEIKLAFLPSSRLARALAFVVADDVRRARRGGPPVGFMAVVGLLAAGFFILLRGFLWLLLQVV